MKGLFISGAGTNIGKTHIGCHIIRALQVKFNVIARKPIESDCTPGPSGLTPKDATLLNNACKNPETIDKVCPYRFEACVSGEKASTDAGMALSLVQLSAACQGKDDDFVVVEGAGGLYSPIAKQALNSDLAAALSLPLVLVIKDELGAVNQALLCLQAAQKQQLTVAMLVLNQITPNSLDNAKTIERYTETTVLEFSENSAVKFAQQVVSNQVRLN